MVTLPYRKINLTAINCLKMIFSLEWKRHHLECFFQNGKISTKWEEANFDKSNLIPPPNRQNLPTSPLKYLI